MPWNFFIFYTFLKRIYIHCYCFSLFISIICLISYLKWYRGGEKFRNETLYNMSFIVDGTVSDFWHDSLKTSPISESLQLQPHFTPHPHPQPLSTLSQPLPFLTLKHRGFNPHTTQYLQPSSSASTLVVSTRNVKVSQALCLLPPATTSSQVFRTG